VALFQKIEKSTNIKEEFRPLKELTEHLTTRADDSHAAPVKQCYKLTII